MGGLWPMFMAKEGGEGCSHPGSTQRGAGREVAHPRAGGSLLYPGASRSPTSATAMGSGRALECSREREPQPLIHRGCSWGSPGHEQWAGDPGPVSASQSRVLFPVPYLHPGPRTGRSLLGVLLPAEGAHRSPLSGRVVPAALPPSLYISGRRERCGLFAG